MNRLYCFKTLPVKWASSNFKRKLSEERKNELEPENIKMTLEEKLFDQIKNY